METVANAPAGARQPVTVRLVGGPAALIEIGGLRLLIATSLVTGFALTGPDMPTIYVSGDNSTSTPGGHHEHH
jgi:hypothetical protein